MRKSWLSEVFNLFITGHGYADKNNRNNAPFLDGLKPVVFLGRLLCALPRNDVLKRQGTPKSVNFSAIISGCLTAFYFAYAVLLTRANIIRFQNDSTTSEKLGEFSLPSYSWTMFFVYGYQLVVGTKRFRNVVTSFVEVNQRSHISGHFPHSFPRFCWILLLISMAFGITENVMFDVQNLKKSKEKVYSKTNSTLELYYIQTYHHWHYFIPYNPVITLLFAVFVKCGTWGWVYMDTIAIVLCKAITEKFRILNAEIEYLISPNNTPLSVKSKLAESRIMTLTWDSIRDEFVMLTDLILEIQKCIAPLILACYGANMYIAIITFYYWIAPYSIFSFEEESYNYFAFVQFLFRVTTVTYFASEVHHASHAIAQKIHRCPNTLYSLSLERLERTLTCNPVGISLFGSFMITRKFFISIVSFIFTTEIVLLQTANTIRTK